MLSKLLKRDLKKNMSWMWILFVATIGIALVTRGTMELGKNVAFFKVVGIFLEGVFYGLAVNLVIQPFLRNFLNFQKSFYSDESYLTHTLPVSKNQLINSKYLTAIIEILAGFITLVVSILIMYAGPNFADSLRLIISTAVDGRFSLAAAIILFVVLIVVEFLMFISIIDFSIIIGFRAKDRKILKTFLITLGISFASLAVLFVVMLIILSIFDVKLTSTTLLLSSSAFYSALAAGIVVYSSVIVLFYFLTKKEFNKGVNID